MADFFPEVLAIPLHQFIGIAPIDPENPSEGITFTVTENSAAPGGYLHGGAVTLALDVAAFFVLIPTLGPGEMAATVDKAVQLIRSVPMGSRVELRGEMIKRGRSLAFMKAVATGQFTKAISHS